MSEPQTGAFQVTPVGLESPSPSDGWAERAGITGPSKYQEAILRGLQDKPIYQGTVSWLEKTRRRAANKRARASRRANR